VTAQMITMGRELGAVLLPPEAHSLLALSLARLGDNDGLRIRLCLDPVLAGLNWEFLRRPQPDDSNSLDGFLALDPRLSIVREPAWGLRSSAPVREPGRMAFVGCRWDEDWDRWEVESEYHTVTSEIAPNADSLAIEPFIPAADRGIERALASPTTIFHYSGHAGVANGRAFLTRHAFSVSHGMPHHVKDSLAGEQFHCDPYYVSSLAALMARAGVQLATFTACFSARWAVVEPLLKSGVPVLIGAPDILSTKGCVLFSQKLYGALAAGLGVDEAVSAARLHVLNHTGDRCFDWGALCVYMTSSTPIPVPAADDNQVAHVQRESILQDRDHAVERAATVAPSSAMTRNAAERSGVFVSYAHEDRIWLQRLQTHLKPYVRESSLRIWDDTRIETGTRWKDEIRKALASARVAVLLVTPDFLASDFIADDELPPLLREAETNGMTIVTVACSSSSYQQSQLAEYQWANDPDVPLDSLNDAEQNRTLVGVCRKIFDAWSAAH